jgi:hypothetical protein
MNLSALPAAGDVVRTADGRIAVIVAVTEQDLHLDLEGDGMCVALRSDPSLVIDRSDATRSRALSLGLRFPHDHGDEV